MLAFKKYSYPEFPKKTMEGSLTHHSTQKGNTKGIRRAKRTRFFIFVNYEGNEYAYHIINAKGY